MRSAMHVWLDVFSTFRQGLTLVHFSAQQGGLNIYYSGEIVVRRGPEHAHLRSGLVSRGLHSSTFS